MKALPADFPLNVLLFLSSWIIIVAVHIFMENSFQVFLTKLLTSTCTFTFLNLSSHYVVFVRLFYLAPVRNTVKICNFWLLSHIIIQPLMLVVNFLLLSHITIQPLMLVVNFWLLSHITIQPLMLVVNFWLLSHITIQPLMLVVKFWLLSHITIQPLMLVVNF